MRLRSCLLLASVVLALPALGQGAREARYQQILENEHVQVYSLELPPGLQAPMFQNVHDVVWVALEDSRVTVIQSEGGEREWRLQAGDTRFLRRFRARRLRNDAATTFRGVVVELKTRGLDPEACGCSSRVEQSVCGCEESLSLPELWALSLGGITLAGTTLGPGQGFQGARQRDDMLLIAVTALQLSDEASGQSQPALQLRAGEASWIRQGRHQFRNLGTRPARFVTVEF